MVHETWDEEVDVVVVGLGGAGCCAALEAAQAGATVLGIERAGAPGGTSALASGQLYLGGGTAVQQACGFDDSSEEMAKYLEAAGGIGADREKIELYARGSVEHFNWLVAHGVPFKRSYLGPEECTDPQTDDCLTWTGSELAHPFSEQAKPAPRGHTVQREGENAGQLLIDTLVAAMAKAGVRTLCDTKVEELVRSDGGSVVGVVARTAGRERRVRARRGVVLSAGGFIHNRDMIQRHAPWLRWCKVKLGCDGDDGSGIVLGMSAGADVAQMDAAMVALPFSPPRQLLKGVLVNRQGQRFINEDVYQSLAGQHALQNQGGQVYLIVDNAVFTRPSAPTEVAAVGDTFQELEHELKLPEGSLEHTMSFYNRHAARAADPLFHKEKRWLTPLDTAPFAAFDLRSKRSFYAAFTCGGLRTRPSGEVLDASGTPIPGLFAAGRNAASVPARGYSSGLSLGDATFFGRLAGASAARREGAGG